MLADSEPKEECYHSLNWVMAGKTNQTEGGVKWESSPHVRMESQRSTTLMQMLLHTERYLHQLWRDGFIPFKAAKQK